MSFGCLPDIRKRSVFRLGGGEEGQIMSCSGGTLLAVVGKWGPRVKRQITIEHSMWLSMDYEQQRRIAMSFFKKPTAFEPPKKGKKGETFVPDIKGAPTVACFLGSDAWPDGDLRERATLIVFVEDGAFKVCLSEKNLNATLWATSATWEGLLEALEDRLTADAPDWRKAKKFTKKS
jgi:hypothetical protein